MPWNWQLSRWPEFTWDRQGLDKAEALFLTGGGVLLGSVRHLEDDEKASLTIDAVSAEAVTTSEIEGDILDRASVQSSIRRQLGFGDDLRRVGDAENGIAEMMVTLYRSYAEPLSDDMLFGWHRMLTSGRRDLRDVGRYRRHDDPMQVVSGPVHAPTIRFEAPPSARMQDGMSRFIDWFNGTAPGRPGALPALTRAGLAHLRFVSIHPFEDGNGRIARALAEKGCLRHWRDRASRLWPQRSSSGARAITTPSSATTRRWR
jgi:Fic family protein